MDNLSKEEQRQRIMELVRKKEGVDCPEIVVEHAMAVLGGGLVNYRCEEGDPRQELELTADEAAYVGLDMSLPDDPMSLPDDPETGGF
jgi:hypothetical protein